MAGLLKLLAGFFTGGTLSSLWRYVGAFLIALLFGVLVFLYVRERGITRDQARTIGEVTALNAGLGRTIFYLEQDRRAADLALTHREEARHAAAQQYERDRAAMDRAESADAEYSDWADRGLPGALLGLLGPDGDGDADGNGADGAAGGADAGNAGTGLAW
jgi:hypothetical protein